jgi:hypothetical protein
MSSNLLAVAGAIVALVATFVGIGMMWSQFGINMTVHGWIAYGLGCGVSIALAVGLFYLTFKSAREGYDDIDRPDEHGE